MGSSSKSSLLRPTGESFHETYCPRTLRVHGRLPGLRWGSPVRFEFLNWGGVHVPGRFWQTGAVRGGGGGRGAGALVLGDQDGWGWITFREFAMEVPKLD
jgi:hypothetical protein